MQQMRHGSKYSIDYRLVTRHHAPPKYSAGAGASNIYIDAHNQCVPYSMSSPQADKMVLRGLLVAFAVTFMLTVGAIQVNFTLSII